MTPWKRLFREANFENLQFPETAPYDSHNGQLITNTLEAIKDKTILEPFKRNIINFIKTQDEIMSIESILDWYDEEWLEFLDLNGGLKNVLEGKTKPKPIEKPRPVQKFFFKSRILKEWVDEFVDTLINSPSLPDEASKNTAEDDLKKQLDRISHMLHKQGEIPHEALYDILTSNKQFMDFYDKNTKEHGEADWNQFILQWGDLLADIKQYEDPAKEYE